MSIFMQAPVVGRVPIGIDPVLFHLLNSFVSFFFKLVPIFFHFHFHFLCPLLFIFRKASSTHDTPSARVSSSLFVSLFLVGCVIKTTLCLPRKTRIKIKSHCFLVLLFSTKILSPCLLFPGCPFIFFKLPAIH